MIFIYVSPLHCNDDCVITLFSHGLADTFAQAYNYVKWYTKNGLPHTNERFVITGPVKTFNYPDAKGALAKLCRVNFTQTSLWQDNEIATLANAYNQIIAQNPLESVLLFGLSRGASGALNFVARHKPNNIKALVLESPFDTVMGIVNDKTTNEYARALAKAVLKCHIPFFKYDLNGIHALDVAAQVPCDLPILIMCSLEDTTVPATSTLRLYARLKATGHTNVHCVVLPRGQHSKLLQGPDGAIYQAAAHAFYKKYGLPHDPALADLGKDLLLTSPNLNSL